MFQSHTELLLIRVQASELDQLSTGEEKIGRNDDKAGASRENGSSVEEFREALEKLMEP